MHINSLMRLVQYLFTSSVHFLVQNPDMMAMSTLAVTYLVLYLFNSFDLQCIPTLHCLSTITTSQGTTVTVMTDCANVKQREHIFLSTVQLLVTNFFALPGIRTHSPNTESIGVLVLVVYF